MLRKRKSRNTSVLSEISRSGYEVEIKSWLKSKGIPYKYETEKLTYQLKPMIYTPDFLFTKINGEIMYVEAKGLLDNEAKRKMIAVKKDHPDKDIRLLFMKDQFVRKGAKNRYSDWANQNKFPWAVGTQLPEAWIKEIDIAKD